MIVVGLTILFVIVTLFGITQSYSYATPAYYTYSLMSRGYTVTKAPQRDGKSVDGYPKYSSDVTKDGVLLHSYFYKVDSSAHTADVFASEVKALEAHGMTGSYNGSTEWSGANSSSSGFTMVLPDNWVLTALSG